jgi:hypothetical protein
VKPEDLKLYPWNPKLRVYIRVYFPELFPQLAAMDVVALKVRTLIRISLSGLARNL